MENTKAIQIIENTMEVLYKELTAPDRGPGAMLDVAIAIANLGDTVSKLYNATESHRTIADIIEKMGNLAEGEKIANCNLPRDFGTAIKL